MDHFDGVRAVMFDLDNTLIVRRLSLEKAAKYVMRFFFPDREAEYPKLAALFCECFISGYDRYPDCFERFKAETGMDESIDFFRFARAWSFYYPFCTTRDPDVECVLELKKRGYEFYMPAKSLCGDNAAMVGSQGYYEYLSGNIAKTDLHAFATMSIE